MPGWSLRIPIKISQVHRGFYRSQRLARSFCIRISARQRVSCNLLNLTARNLRFAGNKGVVRVRGGAFSLRPSLLTSFPDGAVSDLKAIQSHGKRIGIVWDRGLL